MNDYKQHYKNLDTEKIVYIIENESNYKPEAILAAKQELNQRNISKTDLDQIQLNIKKTSEKKFNTYDKLFASLKSFLKISDIDLTKSDVIKIKSISIILILNGTNALFSQWNYLKFVFFDKMSNGCGYYEVVTILSIFSVIVAGGSLWKKNKARILSYDFSIYI